MSVHSFITKIIIAPFFFPFLKLDDYLASKPRLAPIRRTLHIIVLPFVFLYLYLDQLITGKPGSSLNYAADWLESWYHTKITEVNIEADGYTYYVMTNFNHPNGSLDVAADMLQIDRKYVKLVKWKNKKWAIGIEKGGFSQLENRISTFPNLWQKLFSIK